MYLKHKDPPLQSTKEDMYFAEWELKHKNLLFNFQSRTSCFPTVTNYLHLCCHMFLQSGRTCDSGGDHPFTQVHSHWNWTSQRMIQMHEISLSAKIMTHAYLSIVDIVYVKLEQALSWLCTSMFQQAIYVTVLEHGCSKTCTVLGWSSKPSYAYDTTLHVQCIAKYMIECMIFRVARCCFLHPSPAHIITCMTTWKNWCYISLKKREKKGRTVCYARLLTAQEVFQSIPGLGCNCIRWWHGEPTSTCCKENGEWQLLAHSCNAELVWVVCTHVLLRYC